jgi:glycogen synthase
LAAALARAAALRGDAEAWAARVRAAMSADYSWKRSAAAYEDLYRAAAAAKRIA